MGVAERKPVSNAAREADEPLVQLRDGLERGGRGQEDAVLLSLGSRSRVRGREDAAEVRVPLPALAEQRDVPPTFQRDLRTGDRTHTERLRRVRELERAVDAVVVGKGERRIVELRRAGRELLRMRGTVEERVRRVAVELDVAHH